MTNNKNAIIYCRVATGSQGEYNSISSQIQRCTRLAKINGHSIGKVITETANVANKERSGFKELTNLVRCHKINTVYVSSADRIARNFKQFSFFMNLLKRHNAEFVIADITPATTLFEPIGLSYASLDNRFRSERIKSGIAKAKNCRPRA